MSADRVVTAIFGDDYLGFNEGAVFTYNWEWHYEEVVEPIGEVIVEVLEIDEDKITLEVSNGYEEEPAVKKEDYSYTTPFLGSPTFIVLEEHHIEKGTEGFEAIYPGTIMNETIEAMEVIEYRNLKTWFFLEKT